MFGNPLRKSKFAILPEYRFCLCPENSIYDGYVTEKLIDAYAGLTVPLYSGDVSVAEDFNYKAFLNYQETNNMEYFVSKALMLSTNDEYYREIFEQPLLNQEPSLDDAIQFVRSIV
jgi:hypothetical protein